MQSLGIVRVNSQRKSAGRLTRCWPRSTSLFDLAHGPSQTTDFGPETTVAPVKNLWATRKEAAAAKAPAKAPAKKADDGPGVW